MAASADDLRPPPSSARISSDTVRRAVESLMKWKADKSRTENPQLLADEEYVYLNLTLKKIPPKARVNPHKLPLPSPLHSQATGTELCLILDDREKSKLTKAEAKKKVEADDIGVGKILKLSKLKTDYRAYEAKRKLCASYDMFLVDKRLIPLMPKLLGKQFYKKKKIPVPIDLTHRNWKEQISRAFGSALLYLKTGTCSVVKVARVAMEVEEIVDNVISAINGIVEILPKKWDGVRSFHLKLSGSLSLPIYQALPDLKLKISGVEKNVEEKVDEGEVTDDAKKDENVMKKSAKKGRIHDVRYMDTETNDLPDESDLVTEDHSGDENVLDDADNIDSENAADVDASPLKKRKKASSKLDKAAGKKRVKKDASSKKKDSMKTRSEVQEVIAEKKLKKVAKSEKTEGAKLKDKKRNKITK
uniref:Ribosomal protein L1 n=1 Tax=Kalanchoe fedtschenkoi TaxID=63787 RepID=A0A7N0T2W5_KALFE